MTQHQQRKLWHDYCDNDRPIKWHNGYRKHKVQKAEINAHCLASIKVVGLVHVRRREKRDRKVAEVTDICFKTI